MTFEKDVLFHSRCCRLKKPRCSIVKSKVPSKGQNSKSLFINSDNSMIMSVYSNTYPNKTPPSSDNSQNNISLPQNIKNTQTDKQTNKKTNKPEYNILYNKFWEKKNLFIIFDKWNSKLFNSNDQLDCMTDRVQLIIKLPLNTYM